MVSRSEVIAAYRNILKRDPESEEAIDHHLTIATVPELYSALISSIEFRDLYVAAGGAAPPEHVGLGGPPMKVEVETSEQRLKDLVRTVEGTWTGLGQSEPYWSVLTGDQYLREHFAENADAFAESGRNDADGLWNFAARAGINLSTVKTCFEFGCGVGRITQWLAKRFPKVVAVDISKPHLEIAQSTLKQHRQNNVTFLQLDHLERLKAVTNFDLFFSLIVLQHNPPPVIAHILKTVLDNLNPGGLAYFQVPTYHPRYAFTTKSYLSRRASHDEMEMHLLPQRHVFQILEAAGCRVLEIREDGATGGDFVSNTFFAEKLRR